jgi:hypothetical protein
MFIHDTIQPGVAVMKRQKDKIAYTAENTANGAQPELPLGIRKFIAVHEFMRFQIKDDDPAAVPNSSFGGILRCDLNRFPPD